MTFTYAVLRVILSKLLKPKTNRFSISESAMPDVSIIGSVKPETLRFGSSYLDDRLSDFHPHAGWRVWAGLRCAYFGVVISQIGFSRSLKITFRFHGIGPILLHQFSDIDKSIENYDFESYDML